MQISITAPERKALIKLTKPRGATQWFCEKAGISENTLRRIKALGVAEEEIVGRVRTVLVSAEAQELIRKTKAVA